MVEQVLDAKFRYLALAGLVTVLEPEEIDSIEIERELHKDLLPEQSGVIDERETLYVIRVTDLDPDIIERVNAGERAYADSLGIIEWKDEVERNETLGAPLLPEEFGERESGIPWGGPGGHEPGQAGAIAPDAEGESSSPDDEEERPLMEGHGDHWACIMPSLAPFIHEHLTRVPDPKDLRLLVSSPNPEWDQVLVQALPQGNDLETRRLDGLWEEGGELLSAYPVARKGIIHPLTLNRARSWKNRCEGIVEATTAFGASIAFFDTGLLHPWNDWEPDSEQEVSLAALASGVRRVVPETIRITREETIRALRAIEEEVAPEQVSNLDPIEVSTAGMACCFPHRGGNPDEYQVQGPVVDVDVLSAWEQTLYRVVVTVMRDGGNHDRPFDLPIYVAPHGLPDGYRPKVGDDIQALVWVQGEVAWLKYPVIEEE